MKGSNSRTIGISVIVPVHNEEKNIEKCLTSVYNYKPQPNINFHLYIVLNGCTDNSESIVNRFANNKSDVTVLNFKWGHKARAVNQALNLIKDTDICVILDADTIISENYIQRLEDNFSRKEVHVVGADYSPDLTKLSMESYLYKYEVVEHTVRLLHPSPIPIGRFIAFYKSDFMQLPEDIHSEDSFIALDAWIRFGKEAVLIDKSITSNYYPAKTWGDLINQRTRWIQGTSQLLSKYPYIKKAVDEKDEILKESMPQSLQLGFEKLKSIGISEEETKKLLFIMQVVIKENASMSERLITDDGRWVANTTTKS